MHGIVRRQDLGKSWTALGQTQNREDRADRMTRRGAYRHRPVPSGTHARWFQRYGLERVNSIQTTRKRVPCHTARRYGKHPRELPHVGICEYTHRDPSRPYPTSFDISSASAHITPAKSTSIISNFAARDSDLPVSPSLYPTNSTTLPNGSTIESTLFLNWPPLNVRYGAVESSPRATEIRCSNTRQSALSTVNLTRGPTIGQFAASFNRFWPGVPGGTATSQRTYCPKSETTRESGLYSHSVPPRSCA